MPDAWLLTGEVVAAIIVLLAVPLIWLMARRRWLSAQSWVFDCSCRRDATTPSPAWVLGVARLNGDTFEWFRTFSLAVRPTFTFSRQQARVTLNRVPDAVEQLALYDQRRVATLAEEGRTPWELAMAPHDMTAFLSWMEAKAPGSTYPA